MFRISNKMLRIAEKYSEFLTNVQKFLTKCFEFPRNVHNFENHTNTAYSVKRFKLEKGLK